MLMPHFHRRHRCVALARRLLQGDHVAEELCIDLRRSEPFCGYLCRRTHDVGARARVVRIVLVAFSATSGGMPGATANAPSERNHRRNGKTDDADDDADDGEDKDRQVFAFETRL